MAKKDNCWGMVYKLVGWSVASWVLGLIFHFGSPSLPAAPPAFIQQAIAQEHVVGPIMPVNDDDRLEEDAVETLQALDSAGAFGTGR